MTKVLVHIDDGRSQLHCDNPRCGHDLPPGQVTWGAHLIGFPCPKCDSNMLTRRDFEVAEKMLGWVTWLNKWFGWLGSEPTPKNIAEGVTASVHHHHGKLTIERE